MHRTWIAVAALAAATLGAPGARAQTAGLPGSDVPAPPTMAQGPTPRAAAVAPQYPVTTNALAGVPGAPAAARRPFGRSQTLMIVGGATFLAGAIIGDDAGTVLMVAGAGVGIYGLYLYLREPSRVGADRAIGVGYRVPLRF